MCFRPWSCLKLIESWWIHQMELVQVFRKYVRETILCQKWFIRGFCQKYHVRSSFCSTEYWIFRKMNSNQRLFSSQRYLAQLHGDHFQAWPKSFGLKTKTRFILDMKILDTNSKLFRTWSCLSFGPPVRSKLLPLYVI